MMPFADRRDAGRQLASHLAPWRGVGPLVLGLPRGGVPVAYEVATALHAPLDVLIVRKLGCPGQPELGLGAIGEDGVQVRNPDLIAQSGISPAQLERIVEAEQAELARRLERYRGGRPGRSLQARTVLLIDDGLATGFTARAAIEVARHRGAAQVVLAVPVAPAETVAELAAVADHVVCVEQPRWFTAIGGFYDDFRQTSDEEVAELLAAADTTAAPRG